VAGVWFEPAERIAGSLTPPPDKSISHRAALLAAMSDGTVGVRNYLRSADTASTLDAVRALGAQVAEREYGGPGKDLEVTGVGLRGARDARAGIDVGNAGTLLRLLPGWLAGQRKGSWTIDGDEGIRRRPVDRIASPLREMGAAIECRDGRLPPVRVEGRHLRGIRYELPVASAQVKSCLLLAALQAEGETTVLEPLPTRDHTELMLKEAGVPLRIEQAGGTEPRVVVAEEVLRLSLNEVTVPGDFSSAAFLIVAALLVPGSRLILERVGVNPTRTGLLRVLRRMGATADSLDFHRSGVVSGERVADVTVGHAQLDGTAVGAGEVPLVIDELPLLALLGAFAEGNTVVGGAGELRHKESDRIETVTAALRSLGASIEATDDGFVVEGKGHLRGGSMDAAGDHRLAMLGAIAGLVSREGVEVRGFDAAAVSYPSFVSDLEMLTGARAADRG